MSSNDFILVYITNPTAREARKIADLLLKRKLIACANIHRAESIYPWKGKIVRADEWVVVGKTLSLKYVSLKKEIEKIHSYEIPCIIKIPAEANGKFRRWVESSLFR